MYATDTNAKHTWDSQAKGAFRPNVMQSRWCHEKVSSVVSLNHNWIIFWIAACFACIQKKKIKQSCCLHTTTTKLLHFCRYVEPPDYKIHSCSKKTHGAIKKGAIKLRCAYIRPVWQGSLTWHSGDQFSNFSRQKNTRGVAACPIFWASLLSQGRVAGLSRLHVFGRKTSCCEVAEASIQSCHGARTAHFCSPGCFLGHLRPISAQGCNLDWQRIAYNQPKKLFWTDQWGDLRVKPDEFTDWGKA